ncbi:MAG TPA: protocatechuate 3,4-dioxygenase [Desulfobacterales bacterium]|nr:protocatechuate 3,4-dioxygenase [Desulfobacterales bacterium]
MPPDPKRRRLLLAGAAGLLAGPARAARLLDPTPAQTPGPFYPPAPPLEYDHDLTRVPGSSGIAQGRITDLRGRLLDRNGRPIPSARLEIWQCDATGRSPHPRERGGARDPHFQGFGRTVTDAAGRYDFRTLRPVPYPGRTPHIHLAAFPPGGSTFITQIYVRDEPRNADDFLFQRIPPEQRPLVLADFVPAPRDGVELAATFEVILDVTPRD